MDENGIAGLLFSAETKEMGQMLVVMGLKTSKFYIRAEDLRKESASLGYEVELVDEEYEDDEGNVYSQLLKHFRK